MKARPLCLIRFLLSGLLFWNRNEVGTKQETKVFISKRHSKWQICELDWIQTQTGGGGYLNPTISQPQYMAPSLNPVWIQTGGGG